MTSHSNPRPMGNRVLTVLKESPEGLLLLAAGCALLMRSNAFAARPHQAQEYRPGKPAQKESSLYGKVSEAAETARDYVSDVADKVGETADTIASSAVQYTDEARRTVSEKSGRFAEQAQATMRNNFKRVMQEQPLVVAFAGLAAGVAVASAFPSTELEKQALGPTGEFVADVAAKTGERLKEAATKAGEQLKTDAQERGLDADGMKEMVHEAADTFSSAMAGQKNSAAPGARSFPNESSAVPGGTSGQRSQFASPENTGRDSGQFGSRPGAGAWKPGSGQ